MSMMGTLAKVAIGVALAKGAQSMMQNRGTGNAGSGSLFGGANSPQQASSSGGGLEEMLGSVLGGSGSGGGLGGMLEDLQRGNPNTQDGGLDDLLSGGGDDMLGDLIKQVSGGAAGGAGGLGGLIGGLAGALGGGAAAGGGADFGSILNQSLQRGGEPEAAPSQSQEAMAGLMLRAMIQAAKSDGTFDEAEQAALLEKLGDVSAEERAFVQAEMQAPVDANALAAQVPDGLQQQVYTMSLLGIKLDDQSEAQYLHQLASALSLDPGTVNAIHERVGAPTLYQG